MAQARPAVLRGWRRGLLAAGLAALVPSAAAAADGPPRRIVSLNLCADELVLRLVPKARVLSVTTLAADPRGSTVAELARGIAVNRGLAEEVVPLAPDLVVAGAFTTRSTVALLKRFLIPVLELGVPQTLAEAYAQIRLLAERLGAEAAGEAMIAEIEAALAAAPPPSGPAPRAVVLRPNGFTAGRGTLADELMRRAGLDNVAAALSPDKLGQLSIEEIVNARPQVLILDTDPDAPPSLAREVMQHPALAGAAARGQVAPLPSRLWACVGPQLADAFSRLAAAARAARTADMTAARAPAAADPAAP